jgi:hypothetical protein
LGYRMMYECQQQTSGEKTVKLHLYIFSTWYLFHKQRAIGRFHTINLTQ